MNSYATTTDVIAYRGSLSADEMERMDLILETCSAELRAIAKKSGKNLDEMIDDNEDLILMVKKGVVDASVNYLNSTISRDPIMSQYSQAAGGYSISGTLVNPGGAFYFPKKFLRDIGLAVQKIGTIEVFDYGICNNRTDS
jgi:hypothetical protein